MRPSTAPVEQRSALTRLPLLAACLLVLFIVRVIALRFNATDLFFDEAQYWVWGKEPAFGYYSKPPLVAWLIGLTTSVCGDSTFCIRLPAPLIHTLTALGVYAAAARLHDARVAFWSALTFATLPGISLSSGIISTDVPLLCAWAFALWAYVALQTDDGWGPALVLGLALGIGLNAKYAMGFFIACTAVHMAVTPSARRLLADARFWVALALGIALIVPNLAWNASHSFATFAHTADNARWGGSLLNLGKGLEFVGAQFGVFGPILFAALIATVWRAWNEGLPEADRLLLCFTLPVLLLISAQAFVSRAHANWAAVSYVAGTILVCATLLRLTASHWLRTSLAVHLAVLAALAVGSAAAGRFTLPLAGDPFHRTLGWQQIADATRHRLSLAREKGKPFKAVVSDERAITAELLYYMRGESTPVLAWRDGPRPLDHFELTRPFRDPAQVPLLLVALRQDTDRILARFRDKQLLAEELIPAGLGPPRRVRFYSLSGFEPR